VSLIRVIFADLSSNISTTSIKVTKADMFDSVRLVDPFFKIRRELAQRIHRGGTHIKEGPVRPGGCRIVNMTYHFRMCSTANLVSPYGLMGAFGSSSSIGVRSGYPKRAAVEEKTKY
jgi:hypothetical protein